MVLVDYGVRQSEARDSNKRASIKSGRCQGPISDQLAEVPQRLVSRRAVYSQLIYIQGNVSRGLTTASQKKFLSTAS